VLDLRDLRFIDSSGLHAFVGAYRRSEENGHQLLFVGANPLARRLCDITGTEFLLDAEGTAESLDRFTGNGSRDGNREGVSVAHPHA
jgi:anti-anti-sigma factor